jgi:prepilin-type processing-associated H-X9-DG protein
MGARDSGTSAAAPGALRAFTLVELMLVLMVVLLLASLCMAVFEAADEQVGDTFCAARLRTLGKALFCYAESNQGYLPDLGAVSPMAGRPPPCGPWFEDVWDHPGTGQWPASRHTGNQGNLYVLIRLGLASPGDFLCPATGDRPTPGTRSMQRTGFIDMREDSDQFTDDEQRFFQEHASRHCSYSYQNMLGHRAGDPSVADPNAAMVHVDRSPPDLAILADHNPYTCIRGTNRRCLDPEKEPTANSLNHGGRGQNVLYLDGRVQWHDTPECGAELPDGGRDNIYRPAAGSVTDPTNIPRHVKDSYLVP